MVDNILSSFLERQREEALELAQKSNLLDVEPYGENPHRRFALRFHCKGLVISERGISESDYFQLAVHFPDEYLRKEIEPARILIMLRPVNTFHPAVRYPFICPGRIYPGESLVEIIYQCYDILTWRKVNYNERNALNARAATWARNNQNRFPIDKRPLVRRTWKLKKESVITNPKSVTFQDKTFEPGNQATDRARDSIDSESSGNPNNVKHGN